VPLILRLIQVGAFKAEQPRLGRVFATTSRM
jgi:hypothetical protein